MWVKIGNKNAVEIHDEVVLGILNIYPEEKLHERKVFSDSFANGHISYAQLLKECESILVPWQMFFLTHLNLKKEIQKIEALRAYKFDRRFFVKRIGIGKTTSKRIIDRLISLQKYITENYILPKHSYCGALKGKNINKAVETILNYFDIKPVEFRTKQKEKALEYLITRIEEKGINISRGVLKGGVLPELSNSGSVYKNTSGFVIKDEKVPFIFLPDDINPEEAFGRRIYTLMYLIVCIGLDEYDFYIESQFKASVLKKKGAESWRHSIVSELLLPTLDTNVLLGTKIDDRQIAAMSAKYKITPTAVVVILKRRDVISQGDYENLLPIPVEYKRPLSSKSRRPSIDTSVRKFCGIQAFNYVNSGIRNGLLGPVQSQYLIFGRINKKQYQTYKQRVGI